MGDKVHHPRCDRADGAHGRAENNTWTVCMVVVCVWGGRSGGGTGLPRCARTFVQDEGRDQIWADLKVVASLWVVEDPTAVRGRVIPHHIPCAQQPKPACKWTKNHGTIDAVDGM